MFYVACGKHSGVTVDDMAFKPPLKRIGVLGDIHCEDVRLAAALQFFQTQNLDLVCSVGDLIDGLGDPNRTIELLQQFRVVTVRGNHERWLMKNEMRGLPEAQSRFDFEALAWVFLNRLPIELEFETAAGRMLLTHGLRGDDMGGVWPFDDAMTLHSNYPLWTMVASKQFAFVVNGHTHRRLVRSFGEMTIINAGTLYRKHDPCFCIADFEQLVVQYFNVDAEGRIATAEQFSLPEKTIL
ncbi:MAG: metallophosphoesterase family protein [Acidobacteria bacterium]|nr:metallophosphoesterase family protein [Acidobacteriota bacterium]